MALNSGEGEDPTLKVTSVRVAAIHAEDKDTLTRLQTEARRAIGPDKHGRNMIDVAAVAASESKVAQKSAVVLSSWEVGVTQLLAEGSGDELLGHAMVAGIAAAHAIWTEQDVEFVADLLGGRVLPFVQAALGQAKSAGNQAVTQAVADFASAFRGDCALRDNDACSVPGDPRLAFAGELGTILAPYVVDSELAFYLQAWTR
jgi:hypothetical protein